jgi:mRNA interferase RelE/StbE
MSFRVIIPKNLLKFFGNLEPNVKNKFIGKLKLLEDFPKPIGSIKLKGFDNQYRIRLGDFRIRYFINVEKLEILILDIAHRKDIYKKK